MPGTNGALQRQAILIVEDQAVMRAIMRDIVQSAFPRWTILEAADGARAMQICAELRPRLVLMDICLPDANGIELTARVRALLPGTMVIVVSYLNSQIYVEQAHAAGAINYLVKDSLLDDLVPAVAVALGITPFERPSRKQ